MKRFIVISAGVLLASQLATAPSMAAGSAQLMTAVPSSSKTVQDWYKQDVYDTQRNKIGEIMDVLVSDGGQVNALIVGVGGFLGAGEKDVAVPFDAVRPEKKDNKIYLTMETSKDALKQAPGFKYDHDKTTWVPEKSK